MTSFFINIKAADMAWCLLFNKIKLLEAPNNVYNTKYNNTKQLKSMIPICSAVVKKRYSILI